MTLEEKPRPDSPCGPGEVWERDDGEVFDAWMYGSTLRSSKLGTALTSMPASELPAGRYRKRTLDPLPWDEPEETMNCETKTKPDVAGIWQRKRDGGLLEWFPDSPGYRWIGKRVEWVKEGVALDSYRLIIDADGKLVCDPQAPWPAQPKVETLPVFALPNSAFQWPVGSKIVDRSGINTLVCIGHEPCAIDDAGGVVRGLPFCAVVPKQSDHTDGEFEQHFSH